MGYARELRAPWLVPWRAYAGSALGDARRRQPFGVRSPRSNVLTRRATSLKEAEPPAGGSTL